MFDAVQEVCVAWWQHGESDGHRIRPNSPRGAIVTTAIHYNVAWFYVRNWVHVRLCERCWIEKHMLISGIYILVCISVQFLYLKIDSLDVVFKQAHTQHISINGRKWPIFKNWLQYSLNLEHSIFEMCRFQETTETNICGCWYTAEKYYIYWIPV